MELETYLYSHILGGLYGHALGDAWGMAASLRPDQTWSYYQGWLEQLSPGLPDHPIHAGLLAGQVTDDTQQAMALVRTIISNGQITVEGAAKAILAWYDQIDGDNSLVVGPSTQRAIKALKAGAEPHQTGLHGDTNGGAMRVTPIGLIHPGNPGAAIEDAIIACTPTHFTDVALSGACAVAAAVAQAMTPDTTLEDIIDIAMQGAEIGVRRGSAWFGASVARKIDFAVRLATDATLMERERLQNLYDLVGATLAPADSVACAFGVLAMANGNPVETAILAAALSGDADTIGAMACAIAGAWQGVDIIPVEHITVIRQANPEYDFEETAEALYEIARLNYYSAPPSADETPSLDFLKSNQ